MVSHLRGPSWRTQAIPARAASAWMSGLRVTTSGFSPAAVRLPTVCCNMVFPSSVSSSLSRLYRSDNPEAMTMQPMLSNAASLMPERSFPGAGTARRPARR